MGLRNRAPSHRNTPIPQSQASGDAHVELEDDALTPPDPVREWLALMFSAVLMTPFLLLFLNFALGKWPDFLDALERTGSDAADPMAFVDFTPFEIKTGEVLGLMAVIATIVVAVALTSDNPEGLAPQDALAVSHRTARFHNALRALGFGAITTSVLYGMGHVVAGWDSNIAPSTQELSSRLFWATAVFAIALVISFVAFHAGPRTTHRVTIAQNTLPKLEQKHTRLLDDSSQKWNIKPDEKVSKRFWVVGVAIGLLTIPALTVIFVRLVALVYSHPSWTEVAGLIAYIGLSMAVIPIAWLMASTSVIGSWPWTVAKWWSRIWVAVYLVLGILMIALERVAIPFAIAMLAYVFLILWPLTISSYPGRSWLRKVVIVCGYPVHVLRTYALGESAKYRTNELKRLRTLVETAQPAQDDLDHNDAKNIATGSRKRPVLRRILRGTGRF